MPKIMEFHQKSTNFHENLHCSQENSKICCIFRNFLIFCTAPLPRSTFRRRRGTSRTAPEEHGAATGRPKPLAGPLAPRRRAHFPKTTFSPKMASRSAPGASPRPPRTPTGRPLSLPGSPGEVPEHVFHQKLCQNLSLIHI